MAHPEKDLIKNIIPLRMSAPVRGEFSQEDGCSTKFRLQLEVLCADQICSPSGFGENRNPRHPPLIKLPREIFGAVLSYSPTQAFGRKDSG